MFIKKKLFNAVRNNNYKLIEHLLIKNPKLVDVTDRKGYSLLSVAASHNHKEIVKFLLQKGADANLTLPHGFTALSGAASNGDMCLDSVKILIEHGADINQRDNQGLTALGQAKLTSLGAKGKMIDYLKSVGAID